MRALQFIFQNFLYKATALVLAVALWASAQGFRADELRLNLDVVPQALPEGIVVIGQDPKRISVLLEGSRWALREAEEELKSYPISLAGAEPGEVRFEINASRLNLPRGARVVDNSRPEVRIRLDEIAEQSVRVDPQTSGQLPEGFRLDGVVADPGVVQLVGAKTILARLREVATEPIPLRDLRESTRKQVEIVIGTPHVWLPEGGDPSVTVLVRVLPNQPAPAPEGAPPAEPGETEAQEPSPELG